MLSFTPASTGKSVCSAFTRLRAPVGPTSFRFCAHDIVLHHEAVSDVCVESAFVDEAVCKISGYRALIVLVDVQIDGRVAELFGAFFDEFQRERAVTLAAYRRQYVEFGEEKRVFFFLEHDIAAYFAVVLDRIKFRSVVEKREHRVFALKVGDHIVYLCVVDDAFVTFVPDLVCEARYFRDERGICDFPYFCHIIIIICAPARVKRVRKTEIK